MSRIIEKKLYYSLPLIKKPFFIQLIFGGGQMNDNFMKCITSVLRGLLRDAQDATKCVLFYFVLIINYID